MEEIQMKNELLYTIGEFLMTEMEAVEDVRYERESENVLYVITKDGKKFALSIEKV